MSDCPVTVLMPVFNGERFLREAIDSILSQTFREFEFLIIDDGSADRSAEIIRSYGDRRLRVIRNEANIGQPKSLNRGVELARGKYIARMDCDDISLPERLAKQLSYLEAHPECGVAGCDYQVIDAGGNGRYGVQFSNEHHFLRWYLCFQNPLVHPAAMIRRDLLRQAGGYDHRYEYAEDYELWWRVSALTRLAIVPEQLFCLRHHDESLTRRHLPVQMQHAAEARRETIPKLLGQTILQLERYMGEESWNTPVCAPLIVQLMEKMLSEPLSATERELILHDAAARLAVLFLRHPFSGAGWKSLGAALKTDPLVFVRIAGWPVARYLKGQVRNPIVLGK